MINPHAFPEILQNAQNLTKKPGPFQRPLKIYNPFIQQKPSKF